jgi:hypothetical protein
MGGWVDRWGYGGFGRVGQDATHIKQSRTIETTACVHTQHTTATYCFHKVFR